MTGVQVLYSQTVCRAFASMDEVPDVFWVNPKNPEVPHIALCSSRRGGIHVIGLLDYQPGWVPLVSDELVQGVYIDPVRLPWRWQDPVEVATSPSKGFELDRVYLGGYEVRVSFRDAYTELMARMEEQAYQYLKNCTFA